MSCLQAVRAPAIMQDIISAGAATSGPVEQQRFAPGTIHEIHDEVVTQHPNIELSDDEVGDTGAGLGSSGDGERMEVTDSVNMGDDSGRSSRNTRRRKKVPADLTFSSGRGSTHFTYEVRFSLS